MNPKPKTSSLDSYRKTEVTTANRETILLMLYAGAIRFLKGALEAGERKDLAERNLLTSKAQSIVNELRSVLDFKIGGEIATELDRLYAFVTSRLISATIEHNADHLREALKVLESLHTAWEEAVASLKKQKEG
jgi:flagellar secretion chaperone FliS